MKQEKAFAAAVRSAQPEGVKTKLRAGKHWLKEGDRAPCIIPGRAPGKLARTFLIEEWTRGGSSHCMNALCPSHWYMSWDRNPPTTRKKNTRWTQGMKARRPS